MSAENVEAIDAAIGTVEATAPIITKSIDGFVQSGLPNATTHAAKSDPLISMRRPAQMLAGRARLNPREPADHHSCRLGKWYDAQTAERPTRHPAWSALLEPHKEVHRAGIAAARAYEPTIWKPRSPMSHRPARRRGTSSDCSTNCPKCTEAEQPATGGRSDRVRKVAEHYCPATASQNHLVRK